MRKLFLFFELGVVMWFACFLLLLIPAGLKAQAPPTMFSVNGIETLSLQVGGEMERLGSFVLLNPDTTSFRLNLSFANGCKMVRFGGNGAVELTSVSVQTVADSVLMPLWNRAGADCGTFVINFAKPDPPVPKSYEIEVLGSWSPQGSSVLAGRVWEAVTLTITNVSY